MSRRKVPKAGLRRYDGAMSSDRIRRRAQRPTAYAALAALAAVLFLASVAGIVKLAIG